MKPEVLLIAGLIAYDRFYVRRPVADSPVKKITITVLGTLSAAFILYVSTFIVGLQEELNQSREERIVITSNVNNNNRAINDNAISISRLTETIDEFVERTSSKFADINQKTALRFDQNDATKMGANIRDYVDIKNEKQDEKFEDFQDKSTRLYDELEEKMRKNMQDIDILQLKVQNQNGG